MSAFNRILVAIDLSPISTDVLRLAFDMARPLNAAVKVVHAVPIPAAAVPMEGGAVYLEDLHTQQIEGARIQLAECIERQSDRPANLDSEVLSGDPQTEVNDAAQEWKADLIVVGTHGRTGLQHLLMGSVAESILRSASVPVLCLKR